MRLIIGFLLFSGLAGCDSSLPQREAVVGNCFVESDCGGSGLTCKDHQCTACSAHSDCASLVCDTYGDYAGAGAGRCVAASSILYIDNHEENTPSCSVATGDRSLPYCTIDDGLSALKAAPGKVLRLLASARGYSIGPLDASAGAVVLVGAGEFAVGKATTLLSMGGGGQLELASATKATLDGLLISTGGITGSGVAKLEVRRSLLTFMTLGVSLDNSQVVIDRSSYQQSAGGLAFTGSTVSITNSFFTANPFAASTSLLTLSGGSGTFQFNTVAYNVLQSGSLAVSCSGAANVSVKNSIFVRNGVSPQIAAACHVTPDSVVIGRSDPLATQIQEEPAFVSPGAFDLRLQAQDPTNASFLIDKAVAIGAGDKYTDHDYYGTPRPQGAGSDIGAYELPAP